DLVDFARLYVKGSDRGTTDTLPRQDGPRLFFRRLLDSDASLDPRQRESGVARVVIRNDESRRPLTGGEDNRDVRRRINADDSRRRGNDLSRVRRESDNRRVRRDLLRIRREDRRSMVY